MDNSMVKVGKRKTKAGKKEVLIITLLNLDR